MPDERLERSQASTTSRHLLLLTFLTFVFAFGTRTLLYFQAANVDAYRHAEHMLPIWSADAGLYGYYAQHLLAGYALPYSAQYMPGHLIAAVVSVFALPIDSVMFWLPALLASLIVIPIIFSAHAYRIAPVGVVAALIGGIGINFYSRTHLGYMDTDSLNLFFPWMAVTFWIFALKKESHLHAALGALMLLLLRYWYHSAGAILVGLLLGLLLTVLLFFRKTPAGYAAVLLGALTVAPLPFWMTTALLALAPALFVTLDRRRAAGVKPYLGILTGGAIAAPFMLDVGSYVDRAQKYLDKPEMLEIATPHGIFRFSDVLSTVTEAGAAPLWQINPLLTGMLFYVVPATIGFLLLCLRHRAFFSAAVLLLLGFASGVAGIRFSMFATPALALGFSYLGYFFAAYFIRPVLLRRGFPIVFGSVAVGLMLFNIWHFNPHLQPSYFKQDDVKALNALGNTMTRKDLIVSWWDFGWPIWYYTSSDKTLLDNGRHFSDTFYVANMLLSSNPVFVANSAKYADQVRAGGRPEVIPEILKNGSVFDTFRTLSRPEAAITAPGNPYLLLHRDMLLLLPVMASVADRDPKTGTPTRQRQFYLSELREPFTGKTALIEGDTFTFNLRDGVITGNDGSRARVNTLAVSDQGTLKAARQYDTRSAMFLVIYDRTKALYMDGSVFGSFFIQTLLLDRYDDSRFEKIAETHNMKLLRVK